MSRPPFRTMASRLRTFALFLLVTAAVVRSPGPIRADDVLPHPDPDELFRQLSARLDPAASPVRAAIFGRTAPGRRPWDELLERFSRPPQTPEPTTDDRWSDEFGLPGFDSRISDLVVWRGRIVAGGNFQRVGGELCAGLAEWDRGAWRGMGLDEGSLVYALNVVGDTLHAAGRLRIAGGDRGYVAWRTGEQWHVLGPGPSGYPYALTTFEGGLVAAGHFSTTSYDSVAIAQRWNGTKWEPFGPLLPNGSFATSATVFQNRLMLGGYFTTWDSARVAVFAGDGAAWEPLLVAPADPEQPPPYVEDVEAVGTRLYAAGFLWGYPGGAQTLAEWDGTQWTAAPDPPKWSQVRRLAVDSGELIAGGWIRTDLQFFDPVSVARWNESSWEALGNLNGDVSALHGGAGGILAAGRLGDYPFEVTSVPQRYAARWTGTGWQSLDGSTRGAGLDGPTLPTVSSITAIDDTLIVCGNFGWTHTGPAWQRLDSPVRWTGGTWESMSARFLYDGAERIVKWNGKKYGSRGPANWVTPNSQPTSLVVYEADGPRGIEGAPWGARALIVHGGEIYLGGSFTEVAGQPSNGVARWNGSRWDAAQGVPGSNYQWGDGVLAFAEFQGRLIAGGRFGEMGGVATGSVAAWNGVQWERLGDGLEGTVQSLAVHRGSLYAGGWLSSSNEYAGLWRWDGQRWTAIRGPLGVTAMASDRNDLYVAGRFPEFGDIARWDGTTWSNLGSGFGSRYGYLEVSSLFVHDGWLWCGGTFSSTGGKSAFSISRWNLRPPRGHGAVSSPIALRSMGRTPQATRFAVELAAPGRLQIEVFDVRGRRVRSLPGAAHPGGSLDMEWNLRDDSGRRARPGVYFIQARTTAGAATLKVALVE